MKKLSLLMILVVAFSLVQARFSLDLETGLAFSGYNDAKIPNDDASSMFSFTTDLESPVKWASRANLHYLITPRHELSLLYSPITIRPSGSFDRDIVFQGKTFAADTQIDGLYRFDSYRLQYLYRFPNQDGIVRGLGLTLKLRDAEISLENDTEYATKTNTGFVPLIGFEFGKKLNEEMDLILKGEALASPFGRAEDVLLALDYDVNDQYSFYIGYRILEGGSDVDEVYTFALIHYAQMGVRIRL